jgi:hypothetical protein
MSHGTEIRKLARMLRSEGWHVEQTGGNHLRWRSPDRRVMVITGLTPGSHRWLDYFWTDVRRQQRRIEERTT